MRLKEMKLIISRNGDTWSKTVTDLHGNIIFSSAPLKLFPEMLNKEFFDDWEQQLRDIPNFNIVEVERFM